MNVENGFNRICQGSAVFAIACMLSCPCSTRGGESHPAIGDPSLARALEALQPREPTDANSTKELIDQFKISLAGTLAELPDDDQLSRKQVEQLIAAAGTRFELFLNLSYDNYVAYWDQLQGPVLTKEQQAFMPPSRAEFEKETKIFRGAKFDPAFCRARVKYRRGVERAAMFFGTYGLIVDDGFYASSCASLSNTPDPRPQFAQTDAYEIQFAIEVGPTDKRAIDRILFGFVFIWCTAEERWVPWATSILDPSPTLEPVIRGWF